MLKYQKAAKMQMWQPSLVLGEKPSVLANHNFFSYRAQSISSRESSSDENVSFPPSSTQDEHRDGHRKKYFPHWRW